METCPTFSFRVFPNKLLFSNKQYVLMKSRLQKWENCFVKSQFFLKKVIQKIQLSSSHTCSIIWDEFKYQFEYIWNKKEISWKQNNDDTKINLRRNINHIWAL